MNEVKPNHDVNDGPTRRRRVLIAGGGVAAIEALLALRVLAGRLLDIHVLAPGDSFVYRPVSVAEAFDIDEAREFDLEAILTDQHATRHADSLAAVDATARTVRTAAGATISYDELIVAIGAPAVDAVPGALAFRGRPDVPAVRRILTEVETGVSARVAFVLPTGNAWPLPLYELALMTAAHASARRLGVRVLLVTWEEEPLALFGPRASEAVAQLVRSRGVELHPLTLVRRFANGALELAGGGALAADQAVALPRLRGPSVAGLPCDQEGFIPIDVHGRVRATESVYAAGDAAAYPLKQGGLAAQQADAIAEMIAQRAGAAVVPRPFRPVIRGLLLTGGVPIYLRAGAGASWRESTVAGERGAPAPTGRRRESSSSTRPLWWPPAKIAGRYLAPYLATARPVPLASAPLADRGAPPAKGVEEPEHADALELSLLLADSDARWGDYAMALEALDAAANLAGSLPSGYELKRRDWRRELARAGADPGAR